MQIRFRPANLCPVETKRTKQALIFDWLQEFRFSNLDILAARIGSDRKNSERLFKQLRDSHWLTQFTNILTEKNYLMLGPQGKKWAEANGADTAYVTIKARYLRETAQIYHAIRIQETLIDLISCNQITNIYSEHSIKIEGSDKRNRPDALIKTPKLLLAYELERTRKHKPSVFYALYNHAIRILKGEYDGVVYKFENASDLAFYEKLLHQDTWPIYKYRKLKLTKYDEYEVDKTIRDRFLFTVDSKIILPSEFEPFPVKNVEDNEENEDEMYPEGFIDFAKVNAEKKAEEAKNSPPPPPPKKGFIASLLKAWNDLE